MNEQNVPFLRYLSLGKANSAVEPDFFPAVSTPQHEQRHGTSANVYHLSQHVAATVPRLCLGRLRARQPHCQRRRCQFNFFLAFFFFFASIS